MGLSNRSSRFAAMCDQTEHLEIIRHLIRPRRSRRQHPGLKTPMERLRFSLRMLLVLIALIAIPLAWFGYYLNWIRLRHAAHIDRGFPGFVSYAARETLHRRTADGLPYAMRLLGEESVPLLNCGPRTRLSATELRQLFPEADIAEVWYPNAEQMANLTGN